ncbi:ankyrin, partial [Cryphonectria parasitica EP155]
MRLLIDHGSRVDTMDHTGRFAILHAVDSHSVDVLRMLLDAGASPNPQVPVIFFRSSPITAASFGGLTEMVKLLCGKGANVNEENPEGRTALQSVAIRGQDAECAAILVESGADINCISRNGWTALTTSITYNN